MKRSAVPIIAVFSLLLLCQCASSQVVSGAGERDALTQARLQFDALSIDYDASLKSAKDLRRARLINDAQWTQIVNARDTVAKWAPTVRSALKVWQASGVKPSTYDEALFNIMAALGDIRRVITVAGSNQ